MLILSRRESESIHLGDDIVLTIVRVSGEKVRIGIQAPPHIKVLRNELEIEDTSSRKAVVEPKSITPQKPVVEPKPIAPISRSTPIQVRRAA